MYYTSLYRESSSMEYRGKRPEALKLCKQNGMVIKIERNGYFLLVREAEVVIYERDDITRRIVRQCDPRPYISQKHPEYKNITENRVNVLVNNLNKGYVKFEEVIKAAS